MSKIERKYLAHYIDTSMNQETVYERLGKDLEEFSSDLSANVEVQRNILGENRVIISGYDKSAVVEPYYAEKGTALFDRLQVIIDQNLVLEDLKTKVVDVKLWEEPKDDGYPAVMEEAYIEVTSYGGDTTGYRISFTLHYTGNKVEGLFNTQTMTFLELGA